MVRYSNNSGTSLSEAIKITGASTHFESVDAEYQFLSKRFGTKDDDFRIAQQHLVCDKERYYDVIKIILSDGKKMSVFFDITESYNKFVINPQ